MQEEDEKFLEQALRESRQQCESLVFKLKKNDCKTLDQWRRKKQAKVELIIARRVLWLQSFAESEPEQGSGMEEAQRRATDCSSFLHLMEDDMDEFRESCEINIEEVLKVSKDLDDELVQDVKQADQKFREKLTTSPPLQFTELISQRELKRALRVADHKNRKTAVFSELYDKYSEFNREILQTIDDMTLEAIDGAALGGHTLESYLFD